MQSIWVFVPALCLPTSFDFLVPIAGIALPGNWGESCINDLAATSLEPLRAEISFKHLEQLLDNPCFAESLPEKDHCNRVRNIVHHAKADKLLEGAPVIYLEFKFFITKIKKLLKNENLEQDQRICPFAPCIVLELLRIALVEKWAE